MSPTPPASGTIEGIVLGPLGEPMPNPMAASRGDVALVQIEERECLTIVLGEFAAGPGKAGLVMVPRDQMTAAWSI